MTIVYHRYSFNIRKAIKYVSKGKKTSHTTGFSNLTKSNTVWNIHVIVLVINLSHKM